MVLALAGWAVLSAGFFFAPVSSDPYLDLEAGDSFGVFFFVFLPWCALTVVVVVFSLLGVFLRTVGVASVVIGAATVAFGLYVLTWQEMLDYQPALAAFMWVSILIASIAIVYAGLAAAVRQKPEASEMAEEATPARAE